MIIMTAQSVTPHKISIPKYTLGEELVSSISHGIGALLSVAGLTMCIVRSAIHGSGAALAASIVYGISLIILYTMSCIYHALKPNKAKRVFRVFDHCSVFLLIAGTYLYAGLSVRSDRLGSVRHHLGFCHFGNHLKRDRS